MQIFSCRIPLRFILWLLVNEFKNVYNFYTAAKTVVDKEEAQFLKYYISKLYLKKYCVIRFKRYYLIF